MTLLLAFLREDHVIFAADSRHTRGMIGQIYKWDRSWKVEPILNSTAVIGMAGSDHSEQMLFQAKAKGIFDSGSLDGVANALMDISARYYRDAFPGSNKKPPAEFLLAGFDGTPDVATSYWLVAPDFRPLLKKHPYGFVEAAGRGQHAAIYAAYRFGATLTTIQQGKKLAAYCLVEICEMDTSTGGRPQIFVIPKGQTVQQLKDAEIDELVGFAGRCNDELLRLMANDGA